MGRWHPARAQSWHVEDRVGRTRTSVRATTGPGPWIGARSNVKTLRADHWRGAGYDAQTRVGAGGHGGVELRWPLGGRRVGGFRVLHSAIGWAHVERVIDVNPLSGMRGPQRPKHAFISAATRCSVCSTPPTCSSPALHREMWSADTRVSRSAFWSAWPRIRGGGELVALVGLDVDLGSVGHERAPSQQARACTS